MKVFNTASVIALSLALATCGCQPVFADTKISALPNATTLGGTEQIPAVQAAGNVKLTPAQLKTYLTPSFLQPSNNLSDVTTPATALANLGGAGISGTPTAGNCVSWLSATVLQDAGAACGSGSGAGLGANTFTGQQIISTAGGASTSPFQMTGMPFTGGTGTTTTPFLYVDPAGTASAVWNTAGTALGVNGASGFTGNLLDIQDNGISKMTLSFSGNFTLTGGQATISTLSVGTSSSFGWTTRGILSSPAAATVHLGAPDAATPLAQTLGVQNVVAGTSNGAGQLLTIAGSQGTGSGAGGAIQLQVAPAGGSPTVQNAEVTLLKLNSTLHISYGGSAPTLSTCGTSPSLDAGATDSSGTITVGGSVGGSCTMTFNKTYGSAPHCNVTAQSGGLTNFGYTESTSQLALSATALSGNFDYHCDGT